MKQSREKSLIDKYSDANVQKLMSAKLS